MDESSSNNDNGSGVGKYAHLLDPNNVMVTCCTMQHQEVDEDSPWTERPF